MEMLCETYGDFLVTNQGGTRGIEQGKRQTEIRYALRDMEKSWYNIILKAVCPYPSWDLPIWLIWVL